MELKALKEFEDKSAQKMVLELPKMFPPKHTEIPEEKRTLKMMIDLGRKEVKTLLTKLISAYHTDKVNKHVHGNKYFVLCEEITKALVKKCEHFKNSEKDE